MKTKEENLFKVFVTIIQITVIMTEPQLHMHMIFTSLFKHYAKIDVSFCSEELGKWKMQSEEHRYQRTAHHISSITRDFLQWNLKCTFGMCLQTSYTKGILLPLQPADEWLPRMHTKLIPQLFTCISSCCCYCLTLMAVYQHL